MCSEEETDGLNVTIESTDDGSLYVPTPQGMVRENVASSPASPIFVQRTREKEGEPGTRSHVRYVINAS